MIAKRRASGRCLDSAIIENHEPSRSGAGGRLTPRGRRRAAALGVLAAVLAWGAWARFSRPGGQRLPTGADLRYWYLDIQDDFFAKKTAPDGTASFVSRRPLSRDSAFPVVKSSDTFRVFVIGGSVAFQYETDPDRIAGRSLKDVLEHVLPGRRVEVVHCGMGAYDSYRESLVLKEILHYAPDLVVLMSGNNDYRADAGRPSRRVLLALRLRQWLGLRQPPRPAAAAPARPGPAGPPPAFAENLRGMVMAARRAGVAVVLCALPRRLDNAPTGPLPPGFWRPEFLRARNPQGAAGRAAAAAFWRRSLARQPDQDLGHYFLARVLQEEGDRRGARREYAAAKSCRARWDTNPIVRETASELGSPLADLEAAFDGLPYALDGGAIYRDSTHWYRYLDPLVSCAIAQALLRRPEAVRARLDGAWLARRGAALAAPGIDAAETEADYVQQLSWTLWRSAGDAPRLSEQALMGFDDLRRIDPAAFAALPWLKAPCREAVNSNLWTKSEAGNFERRWSFGLAHAGEVYRRAGQPRLAVELFEAALHGAPEMRFWKLYEALALGQLGRRAQAARALESISGPEQDFAEVRGVGEFLGLRPAPHPGAALKPGPPGVPLRNIRLVKQAARLEAAGRRQAALSLLRPVLGQDPPDQAVLLTALRIAVAARQRATAELCLSRLQDLRLPPGHVILLAEALRALGRPEAALAAVEKALVLEPRAAPLLDDKGVLESLLGRPSQAESDLKAAIRADPDFGSAYVSLGALLSSRGDAEPARRAYAEALSRPRIQGDASLRGEIEAALRALPPGN